MRILRWLPALLLAGCAANPPPPAQPVASGPTVAPLNSQPLATGQYPAGTFGNSGPNQPFQPANSFPRGGTNAPR